MAVNSVCVSGNLGRDAELKQTPSGKSVLDFSLAVNEHVGDGKTRANWIDVALWGRRAEALAPYLRRGTKVCVHGRLRQRTWEGDDGVRRSVVGVVADDVDLMGPKEERPGFGQQPDAPAGGDIPF